MNGYAGKVLYVDLSNNNMHDEGLPEEKVLRAYLGCWGLALRMLYDMALSGVQAKDPGNPMIFWNGPLTAVDVPGNTNLSLATKNFNTNFTAGRSHTHGKLGINLKRAGYDGVVITGSSEKPAYLFINDNGVELKDAGYLWGKDTHETEEILKGGLGESVSVAAIGPAGENLCAGGMICNDRNHSLAHSGVGSVMGSKKLKAIVIQGSKAFPIAHPESVTAVRKAWLSTVMAGARYKRGAMGQSKKEDFRSTYRRCGGFVGMNFQKADFEEFGIGTHKHKMIVRPCHGCPYGCPVDLELVSGAHKGMIASISGGAEGPEGAGAIFGIANPEEWLPILEMYDRLGIEASVAGSTIAMAIEAYQKGIITSNDTDGLELEWGNPEVVTEMLRKMVYKEGFGAILALGPLGAARALGRDATDFVVHIKGSGMNLHDWRHSWGMLLGHIVSSGSGWPATAADAIGPEPDAGYTDFTDCFDYKSKALEARKTGILKFMRDTLGTCGFMTWNMSSNLVVREALRAVTGWDISIEELWNIGEKVMNLERSFNIRHGLTPADDYSVSPRLLEAPHGGRADGKSIGPHIVSMIDEYYRLMGWDLKTGRPWRATLERLGLHDIANDMWG